MIIGTIREAAREALKTLRNAGVEDADTDVWRLLAAVCGGEPLELRLRGGEPLPEEDRAAFEALVLRRAGREPLQYIEGDAEFMGLRLEVTPDVLIPRGDTEVLCEEALRLLRPGMRALDIGTGSGALALALKARCPMAEITAADVSARALAVARRNAEACGVCVEFLESDCFGSLQGRRFDLIVSNPPYLSRAEMEECMPELAFEPAGALFGGEDGLDFYRRICREAPDHLEPGGALLLEIGWRQKEPVEALLRRFVGEPRARRDYGGNWRVLGAQTPGNGREA